jgi:hypothetical protein
MTRTDYDVLREIAMTASELTGGAWRSGKSKSTVVCDKPCSVYPDSGHDDIEYYGGHLVAESICAPGAATFVARFHPAQCLELLALVNREDLPE